MPGPSGEVTGTVTAQTESEQLASNLVDSLTATRWVGVAAFALSLIGVGLSTDMTIAHFTEASILACSGCERWPKTATPAGRKQPHVIVL